MSCFGPGGRAKKKEEFARLGRSYHRRAASPPAQNIYIYIYIYIWLFLVCCLVQNGPHPQAIYIYIIQDGPFRAWPIRAQGRPTRARPTRATLFSCIGVACNNFVLPVDRCIYVFIIYIYIYIYVCL